ncbi:threonine ammonia-lyase [Hirschia baltica]|uniref:Threonine dehydratase n=1 Tax=Hirschia baltica (strain ATCC 49814 / DSM 5838 / IFAM 1418) TaxID=582402 RepID=C6XKH2_HIRBI|nr:threonine dehydratase [Hirschia baltica ATCC 49814]
MTDAKTISYEDILAAAKELEGELERTPMRKSRTLSEITGAEIWIKFENLQFTAAFKERGALNKLKSLTEAEKKAGVVAMSAGNHAQGVAYHAARLGIPATIVMPKSTPFVKVEHTRNYGARVILHGEMLTESDAYARELEAKEGLTFIHPYDDAKVVAGQGTIALEMLEDQPDLEYLVVPVGGGGLIGGMTVAAKHINPDIHIVGVEPSMYPSLTAEMRNEEAQVGGATIAEGIAVKKVGEIGAAICREMMDEVLLVEEEHLERAITLLATVEKTVAEGAGAAGLAALLAYPQKFSGRRVGLVVCGGNIDTRLLASVLTRSLVREKRLASIRMVGGDNPGLLADVSRIIGEGGANIIEVAHNRIALDVPAKGAEFDILIETRDAQHTQDIVDALSRAGFPPRSQD